MTRRAVRRRDVLAAGSAALMGLARPAPAAPDSGGDAVRALVFDTFGTVVDWRSSVIRELEALAQAKNLKADWAAFADAWRGGYGPSMNRVRKGELPWTALDELHRMTLDGLLEKFHVTGLTEDEKVHLNFVWHRLDPWPDAVSGLTRLKRKYIIAPMSNGNVALLVNMAKRAGLPWDCIFSAELARRYKPDKAVYLLAPDYLDVRPDQVMMVAAHKDDLRAAKAVGLKTAFVPRPLEHGPKGKVDVSHEAAFDLNVGDFNELAAKLGV
jgi:2-haloacid dehalogenase